MTASNQLSLFTAFVIFTAFALVAAMMKWFGSEVVLVTLFYGGVFLAMAIVVHFAFVTWINGLRNRFKRWRAGQRVRGQVDDHIITASVQPKPKAPNVEFVIATADSGLVSEPNSSIRYLDPPVNDRDIARLADCTELKWLVLDNTDVSDAGLAVLHGMTKLRRIYIRGSRVTAEGVEQLKAALPDATVLY